MPRLTAIKCLVLKVWCSLFNQSLGSLCSWAGQKYCKILYFFMDYARGRDTGKETRILFFFFFKCPVYCSCSLPSHMGLFVTDIQYQELKRIFIRWDWDHPHIIASCMVWRLWCWQKDGWAENVQILLGLTKVDTVRNQCIRSLTVWR